MHPCPSFRPSPGPSNPRQDIKVFWFFSSEKNKSLFFLKKKKQKDFYSWCWGALRGRLLASLIMMAAGPAFAAWPEAASNPKPMADDLVLPMPCGGEMVFRPVLVPAKDLLDDQRISLGGVSPEFGYKEYQHADYIAGGFAAANAASARLYYLGKYDVTRAQFGALSGTCPAPSDDSALPQTAITWTQAVDFADSYTAWLIANARDKLPSEAGQPGFLRLPTEEEWEYAARGGARVSAADFAAPLFPMSQPLAKYVWYNGTDSSNGHLQPIGLLLPNPLGLFDILGDAQQFSSTLFRLNRLSRLHGGAGGYVIRGGSYQTPPDQIRTSARDEFVPYDSRGPRKQKTVGFRLALVAPSLPGLARLRAVKEEWQALPNAAGGALAEPVQDDPLKETEAIAAAVEDPGLKHRLQSLEQVIAANIKTRNDQIDRAARASLDLATWLGARMSGDATRVLAAEFVASTSSSALLKARSEKSLSDRKQDLANTIGPYRDTLRALYTEYPAAVRDAQAQVLQTSLIQQGNKRQADLVDQVKADIATLQRDGDLPDAVLTKRLIAAACARPDSKIYGSACSGNQ